MTRKQIDQARETRLWLSQVLVPAAMVIMAMSPEKRQNLVNSAVSVKNAAVSRANKFVSKFKKEGP